MAPSKRDNRSYSEEAINAACHSVILDGISVSVAARRYGVSITAIGARLPQQPSFRVPSSHILSPDEESKIVKWLIESSQQGFSQTKDQLLLTVQAVLQESKRMTPLNLPDETWYRGFMERQLEHHTEVPVRKSEYLPFQWAALTKEKIEEWFETALQDIAAKEAEMLNHHERLFNGPKNNETAQQDAALLQHPRRIFNCCETKFVLGGRIISSPTPIINDTQMCQFKNIDTNVKEISVMACGSASGEILPPFVIFPGTRFRYNLLNDFPEAHFTKSPCGDVDAGMFKGWLETSFILAIKDLPKPVLLFVDGYKSLVNSVVFDLCRDHGIILYQLHSHPSLLVQPLDLTTFETLKDSWKDEVTRYEKENKSALTMNDFAKVLRKAWKKGMQKDAVVSGFRTAGIYPWKSVNINTAKDGPNNMNCDADSNEHINLISSNQIVTPTTRSNESSVQPLLTVPTKATVSTGRPNVYRELSNAEVFDKILLIAASLGTQKVTELIETLHLNRQPTVTDPVAAQFCSLYCQVSNVIDFFDFMGDPMTRKAVDSLSLPSKRNKKKTPLLYRWNKKKTKAPKRVSSSAIDSKKLH